MRYVDEEKLLQRAANGSRNRGAIDKLRRWLLRQPRAPHLLSRSAAADMLGVSSPYISRLHDQGRMPDAVEVEGSAPVYVKEELEPLARELNQARRERQRRREKRKVKA